MCVYLDASASTVLRAVRVQNLNPGKIKVKGEVVSVHAMKTYRGSRGIAPLILNPEVRWR